MGGGGGGTATSSSGLPDWAQPYVESSVGKAVGLEEAGAFSHVEDLTPEQQDAFQRKLELGGRGGVYDQIAADSYGAGQAYRDAAAGTGLFGSDALGQQAQALESTIGKAQSRQLANLNNQASLGGTLGSARNQLATNTALSRTAGDIAGKELAARRQSSSRQGLVVSSDLAVRYKVSSVQASELLSQSAQHYNNKDRTKVMQPTKVCSVCSVY